MYDADCIECRHECHNVDTTVTDDYVHQMVKAKIPYNDKKGRSYSILWQYIKNIPYNDKNKSEELFNMVITISSHGHSVAW